MEIDRLRDDARSPLAATDTVQAGSADVAPDGPVTASAADEGSADERSADGAERRGNGDQAAVRADYRAKVDAVYLDAAREHWRTAAKSAFRHEWLHYAETHPASPRTPVSIDQAAITSVRRGCAEIRETEEKVVTPAMLRIEAEDSDRHLVGLEFRCKEEDRILEKVAEALEEQPNLTPEEALASVKDTIRYTFQYTEEHYTEGVYADIDRLKAAGFKLAELRNSWGDEEYKGINSRWRIPENGQLFEVQFHTTISFEAKQLTHPAYELIRNPATPHAEIPELRSFQRRVTAEVPRPSGAIDIPTYP
jgi:hypothetical protein